MEEIVYLNGSLVPRSKARISIDDHGFLCGYGLFQTMRTYNGKYFLLDRHLERLKSSAEVIGLAEKLKGIDLEKACRDTLKVNDIKDARVRVTVTNGAVTTLPWIDSGGTPTVLVTTRPYTPFSREKYSEGFKVGIASVRRMRQSVTSSMKSINYLQNVVARIEAAEKGWDETILLNDEGYIAEGGGSNVFFVREGRLITPALNSGIIPGVTREVVIELANNRGIGVSEGPVGIGVFKKCEEIFITNAMIEIMPVTTVCDNERNAIIINAGKPGEITRKLTKAYQERVEKEIG